MLVDIVIRNHEVVAAEPTKAVLPITLYRTEEGHVLPAVKWPDRFSGSGVEGRLQNRVFGRLKGAALKEAYNMAALRSMIMTLNPHGDSRAQYFRN
jgi:hypothetical protein